VPRKSYTTELVVLEDDKGNQNIAPPQNGGFLVSNIFTLTIPQVIRLNTLFDYLICMV